MEHLCDEWPGDYAYPTDIIADVRDLLAERDALREALEKIVKTGGSVDSLYIARAALERPE